MGRVVRRVSKALARTPGDEDSVDRIAADWRAATPDQPLDAFHVYVRIQHAARFYERTYELLARKHGIAAGDIYVLLALRRSKQALTPTELFRELSVTSGAMTKRLDRLAALKLVTSRPDTNDARSVRVALTRRGRAIVDRDIVLAPRAEVDAVYALTPTEREILTTLLRKLLVQLERSVPVTEKGALRRVRPADP